MLIQQALIQKGAATGQIAGTKMSPGPSTHEVLSPSSSLSLSLGLCLPPSLPGQAFECDSGHVRL